MERRVIYLVVGCPGSGKSWVCSQLAGEMDYVPHDDHFTGYVSAILRRASAPDTKPLIIESPFSVNEIRGPLESAGYNVRTLYIIEPDGVIAERYQNREKRPIPPGHLTRQQTYLKRAIDQGSFHGTSQQVLEKLQSTLNQKGYR